MQLLEIHELTPCIFIGRAERAVRSDPPLLGQLRAFGVDLCARHAEVNLDSKPRTPRRFWDTLEHDMAGRHAIVELLQTVTHFARRGLERP